MSEKVIAFGMDLNAKGCGVGFRMKDRSLCSSFAKKIELWKLKFSPHIFRPND